MNFWERVNDLLELKEINKKTLAYEAGFDASNISKGIKNGNVPAADTALKIAKILGVSVEYLVTGNDIHHKARLPPKMFAEIISIEEKLCTLKPKQLSAIKSVVDAMES